MACPRHSLWIFVYILILISCSRGEGKTSSAPIKPLYNLRLHRDDLPIAVKAFDVFSQVCQPLMGKFADDIESIEVSEGANCYDLWDQLDFRCTNFGWDRYFSIKVKIKDHPKYIPNSYKAWNHTIWYSLGGDKNPGIVANKIAQLCGVRNGGGGGSVDLPVPALSFIRNDVEVLALPDGLPELRQAALIKAIGLPVVSKYDDNDGRVGRILSFRKDKDEPYFYLEFQSNRVGISWREIDEKSEKFARLNKENRQLARKVLTVALGQDLANKVLEFNKRGHAVKIRTEHATIFVNEGVLSNLVMIYPGSEQ
ncbi:hypothetical protein [uncultured Thiodictyon sp.]|uniref:hypothetical protein n=1 Tax=uncultured Thiodictyon sp. TaxID=1846217 RepID=UPI0025FD9406|nr:hypothetical protein [uncultured Thiodictyon sp.]